MKMTKRFLVAVLALAVSACAQQNNGDAGLGDSKAGLFSLFDPTAASPTIPFPFDGLFSGFTDPTLNIPNSGNVPFVRDANLQDGFSTTASIFTDFIGFLDFNSLFSSPALPGLLVVDTSTSPPTILIPGIDYTVQPSPAVDSSGHPISSYRSRLLIEPLKPLKQSTRYIVAVTTGAKSVDGVNATASDLFRVVRSATAVSASTEPILATLNPTQKATLEALRSQLIRPVVVGLGQAGIPEQVLVLAWSFTTQSVTDTLAAVEAGATAQSMTLVSANKTLHDLNPALPNTADVYAGTLSLPYFLSVPDAAGIHSTVPLTDYWHADPAQPDTGKSFLGQVPCGAFAAGVNGFTPSVSTTACFPVPVKQTDVTVPVLASVPNANSGLSMPTGGWPVVIFQHGITGNRSQMLALAPALTQAGFAVVAIDLPLHGILPTDAVAALRLPGVSERTFDLDLENNSTGAPGPDGLTDPSGQWFINLSSVITSRDNLRQAEADLITLTKSLGGAVFLTPGYTPAGIALDATQRRFVGHSLGGIVGGAFLGVNNDIGAATLAMPGGGVAKLLDGSGAFGPVVAAGLASNHVNEGTDDYETFLRFAQTLVDSGDPINYAAAAGANHPIHMIEVINDGVVPNNALARVTGVAGDKVLISGYLSGTDPLAMIMGQTIAGPLDVPVAAADILLGPAARNVTVQFNQGDHGSILSPAASPAATQEMQRETASFLGSNGLCLPIGGNCPVGP